jgi:virulence-associated protein VagC
VEEFATARERRSTKELKITAALYASRSGVVEYVRANGRLPKEINIGGADIGMRLLIERRGTDITLTPDEQLVYDAILKEKRLPGGSFILIGKDKKQNPGKSK